jgi:alpha-N-arabinofuranosidase
MASLSTTILHLDVDDVVADVDPRLFGGLLEHMGRCVYGGIYDPESRQADAHGCRADVLDTLRRLDMTAIRYPGGNFVSGYDWRDGIGPRAARPRRLEKAWKSIEPNTFGTDEFLALCERMRWTPMMAVNLGTAGPDDARELIAYTNAPRGTAGGDRRAANGREAPYGVALWCLGNEMDGPWQIGHCSADEYARRASETAAGLREVSPDVEVVGCGPSDPRMPNHPRWTTTLLDRFGDGLDYLSVHRYARNFSRRTTEFLGFGVGVDRQIEALARLVAEAQARHGRATRTRLSFDEWNVWYKTIPQVAWRFFLPRRFATVAPPLIEEVYDLEDALVCAGFLNSFIRHADVVRIANLAQMVNVIAPLLTRRDGLLVQSIFHAFRMFSTRRAGDALRIAPQGPSYRTRRFGEVPVVDASAIHAPAALHVFAVNRSTDRFAPLEISVAGATLGGLGDAEILTGPSARARNTWEQPDVVTATPFAGPSITGQSAALLLPPLSLVAVTLRTGSIPDGGRSGTS